MSKVKLNKNRRTITEISKPLEEISNNYHITAKKWSINDRSFATREAILFWGLSHTLLKTKLNAINILDVGGGIGMQFSWAFQMYKELISSWTVLEQESVVKISSNTNSCELLKFKSSQSKKDLGYVYKNKFELAIFMGSLSYIPNYIDLLEILSQNCNYFLLSRLPFTREGNDYAVMDSQGGHQEIIFSYKKFHNMIKNFFIIEYEREDESMPKEKVKVGNKKNFYRGTTMLLKSLKSKL
jgi:putative methyltransferase (TIGR04325 family)